MAGTKKKFALLPRIVKTWRSTYAIIWMQEYFVKGNDLFFPLNGDDNKPNEKYCLVLGMFSIELPRWRF